MDNPLGVMKVALGQELTLKDCKTLATLEGLPPAVRDKTKDGLSLMCVLEQRGRFSKDDVSYLVTLFTNCDLHRAANIAKNYQTKSIQKTPNNPLGELKIAASKEFTYHDCQMVATMAGFPPAERERMKDGVTLMNTLECKGYYKEKDVERLLDLCTKCELHKVAGIIEEYQNNNNATHTDAATPDRPCHEPTDTTLCPDFTKDHMKDEIPEWKLAIVAKTMGEKAKNFSLSYLRLSSTEVENCEFNVRLLEDRNFKFLKQWKDNVGEKATYKKLAKLLHKAEFSKDVWGVLEIADDEDEDED